MKPSSATPHETLKELKAELNRAPDRFAVRRAADKICALADEVMALTARTSARSEIAGFDSRRYITDDFLVKIMDRRYSSEWVGIALRWQLNAAPQTDGLNKGAVGGPDESAAAAPDTSRSATAESDPVKALAAKLNEADAERYRKLRAEMSRGDVPMGYLPANLHGVVGAYAFDRAVDEGWK